MFKKDSGAFGKGSVGEVHFSLTNVTFSVKDLNQKPTPWQKTSSADFQRPRVPSWFGGASRHGFATFCKDGFGSKHFESVVLQCLTLDLQ